MGASGERVGRARARGDDGTALVEFALVSVLLLSIVFGIIHYGLILSFKQDVTRAAAEGARAAAVAFPATDAEGDARDALTDAIHEWGGPEWGSTDCYNPGSQRDGFRCNVTEAPCAANTAQTCVTVELYYDYDGDGSCGGLGKDPAVAGHPLFGEIPVIGGLTQPDCVSATSTARTNA
jgi:TadE-like protein